MEVESGPLLQTQPPEDLVTATEPAMGNNIPLCVPKKHGFTFGDEFADLTKNPFSPKAHRPYDMSFEDLRPKSKVALEDGGPTILGLEMDQESV